MFGARSGRQWRRGRPKRAPPRSHGDQAASGFSFIVRPGSARAVGIEEAALELLRALAGVDDDGVDVLVSELDRLPHEADRAAFLADGCDEAAGHAVAAHDPN